MARQGSSGRLDAAPENVVPDTAVLVPAGSNSKLTKADHIAEILRSEIATGHWPTGRELPPEAEILQHFNVSRPPMREAMRMLESEGLLRVARGQRGGARVLSPDLGPVTRAFGVYVQHQQATMDDLFETLALCETNAVREIADSRSHDVLVALAQIAAAQSFCTDDRDEFNSYEVAFRRKIIDSCSNVIIKAFGNMLAGVYERHMRWVNRQIPPLDTQAESFRRGVNAKKRLIHLISQGKADLAEEAWRSYLMLFNQLTAEFLSDTHIEYYSRSSSSLILKNEDKGLLSKRNGDTPGRRPRNKARDRT